MSHTLQVLYGVGSLGSMCACGYSFRYWLDHEGSDLPVLAAAMFFILSLIMATGGFV